MIAVMVAGGRVEGVVTDEPAQIGIEVMVADCGGTYTASIVAFDP